MLPSWEIDRRRCTASSLPTTSLSFCGLYFSTLPPAPFPVSGQPVREGYRTRGDQGVRRAQRLVVTFIDSATARREEGSLRRRGPSG